MTQRLSTPPPATNAAEERTPDKGGASRLHFELIHGLMQSGACPSNSDLAAQMGIGPEGLQHLFVTLADIHGVVLHPHVCEPWVVHPFSLTPTLNWIEGKRASWWSPCVWCAFGAAKLVGGDVRVHTRYGGESEPLVVPVSDGQPVGFDDVCVHFAIPPARAWDNVHQHCSMVLPFRSVDEIDHWCRRHRLPREEVVPLHQVAELASNWYGHHSDPNWRKWSVAEAQDIFNRTGLRSQFWDLGARSGKF